MSDTARTVAVYVMTIIAVGWIVTLGGMPLTRGVIAAQTLAVAGLAAGLPVAYLVDRRGVTLGQLTDFWTALFVLGVFVALPVGTRIAAANLPITEALAAQGVVMGITVVVATAVAAAGGYGPLMERLPG